MFGRKKSQKPKYIVPPEGMYWYFIEKNDNDPEKLGLLVLVEGEFNWGDEEVRELIFTKGYPYWTVLKVNDLVRSMTFILNKYKKRQGLLDTRYDTIYWINKAVKEANETVR